MDGILFNATTALQAYAKVCRGRKDTIKMTGYRAASCFFQRTCLTIEIILFQWLFLTIVFAKFSAKEKNTVFNLTQTAIENCHWSCDRTIGILISINKISSFVIYSNVCSSCTISWRYKNNTYSVTYNAILANRPTKHLVKDLTTRFTFTILVVNTRMKSSADMTPYSPYRKYVNTWSLHQLSPT